MKQSIRGTIVKYNGSEYRVSKQKNDKVNLCSLYDGKILHRDVLISELWRAGGNKERKIKV